MIYNWQIIAKLTGFIIKLTSHLWRILNVLCTKSDVHPYYTDKDVVMTAFIGFYGT